MHYLAIPMVLKNKQTNKKNEHKELFGILQSIVIVVKGTRVDAYTCRYSSELLIPNLVISG